MIDGSNPTRCDDKIDQIWVQVWKLSKKLETKSQSETHRKSEMSEKDRIRDRK